MLVAAHEAIKAFKSLPSTASRTFFYTGNILNSEPITPLLSLGIGKSASAHIIHAATIAYADQGFKYVAPHALYHVLLIFSPEHERSLLQPSNIFAHLLITSSATGFTMQMNDLQMGG
jgi:hypothetical protein